MAEARIQLPTAKQVVDKALSYVRTQSYGSKNQFTKWYFGNDTSAPWCAIFVFFVLNECGGRTLMDGCENKAYCPTIWRWADGKAMTLTRKSTARAGDLALFDWDKDTTSDHIGIVVSDNGDGTVTTVEGNTSDASRSNGGCVQKKVRKKSDLRGFVRLPYAIEKPKIYATGTVYCYGTNKQLGWNVGNRTFVPAKYIHSKKTGVTESMKAKGIYAIGTVYCYSTNPIRGWKIDPDGFFLSATKIKNRVKI